ncbi:hypothetical protein Tco_0782415 [Tanacetum coccineum]
MDATIYQVMKRIGVLEEDCSEGTTKTDLFGTTSLHWWERVKTLKGCFEEKDPHEELTENNKKRGRLKFSLKLQSYMRRLVYLEQCSEAMQKFKGECDLERILLVEIMPKKDGIVGKSKKKILSRGKR